MNANLKDLLDRVESWPEAEQEAAAASLLAIEQEITTPHELSDEDRAAIDLSLDQMRQGRFASDAAVAAVFNHSRRS
jgi:hypothetical protein